MNSLDYYKALTALKAANLDQSPVNRLAKFASAWASSPRKVRRTALRGLYIRIDPRKLPSPSTSTPKAHYCKSARDLKWAQSEIQSYLSKGILFPSSHPNPLIHPYFVIRKRGKARLVIDFRSLNAAILESPTVAYQDLRLLPTVMTRKCWMMSVDIKSAFHHIPLSPVMQPLCSIIHNGVILSFRVLTFGVNIAPKVWCSLLSNVLDKLKQSYPKIRVLFYMDDILLVCPKRKLLYSHSIALLSILHQHGFLISWEKSVVLPCRSIRHLGFIINSETLTLSLPPDKLKDITSFLLTAATKPTLRFKSALSLLGKLISIRLAFLPAQCYSWRLCTEIYASLPPKASRLSRRSFRLCLSSEARADLLWIHHNLPHYPSRPILHPTPTHQVFTDSCLTGWGAWCPVTSQALFAKWPPHTQHIQLLEMNAVLLALSHLDLPPHARLHLYSDNQAVVAYLRKWGGTRSPELRDLTHRVWQVLASRNLSLVKVSYIPTDQNKVADLLSRLHLT